MSECLSHGVRSSDLRVHSVQTAYHGPTILDDDHFKPTSNLSAHPFSRILLPGQGQDETL